MKSLRKSLILLVVLPSIFFSQDGTLDTSFDTDGKVTTSVSSSHDYGKGVAIQSDGKIIVVGYAPASGSTDNIAVIRFNVNGSLDTDFGIDGIVTTGIGSTDTRGESVVIQPDGKIIVVGSHYNGSNSDFAVVRYNVDGSLDNGFGTNGTTTMDFDGNTDIARSVTLQDNGRIVVAGETYRYSSRYDFGVARFYSDGTIDPYFSTDGKLATDVGGLDDKARSVIIKSGYILVAGESYNTETSNYDFAVVSYNSGGTETITFDALENSINTKHEYGRAIASDGNGKIVVAGYSTNADNSNEQFAVIRYNTIYDRTIDDTFGTNGIVRTTIGDNARGQSLAIQADGKMVVAGYTTTSGNDDFAIVRYNTDGTLDNTFGANGIAIVEFGTNDDEGFGLALQSDGKIVVSGRSVQSVHYDFAVLRFTGSSGPLPVKLTSFTANLNENILELNWQTATEVNNYGFEIERSVAQISNLCHNWETIGFVEGHGNSNSPKDYSFVDLKTTEVFKNLGGLDGELHYRLKQIDFDGNYEYSNVIEVKLTEIVKEYKLEQNYPNPFNPTTTIKYSIPNSAKSETSNVKLIVYDILGSEVATLVNEKKSAGNYEVKFNASNLASGIYIYRIAIHSDKLQSGSFVQTKKFVLMK
ncbi:MAG: T9SS type A sorting domain-containing protein [Bacteroidetes bacterium]|nr:T9SS type A sorting domain-containing protein [Bacteroidota bacterium]MBU1113495.1 T9SS type A sorting domain-containing protein [Bacteroidota bacterium]MBU1798388.1 T9SS type A sorting domain-containing protein [Bacteroidota bacterium]